MTRSRLIVFTALLGIFIACRHETEVVVTPPSGGGGTGGGGTGGGGGNGGGGAANCDPSKVYFQQQVLPVLLSNCAMSGCHDVASHQDGVILTSFEYVMATAGIRPGNPNDSELYEMITESDPEERMPPAPRPRLSSDQISLIRNWILQGAQNLSCTNLCDSTQFTYSGAIKTIISNKCQGCHSGTTASAGIDLSTYLGLKSKVTDGRLWGAVNHLPNFSPMPKNGNKLSECELTQIRKWIDAGAPNN
jgi:hypothetical protein